MATREQTRANQENARHSTGPRTADGKAKSSQNAFKHGLRAQATVLPDENLDDFEFLVSELEDQFQPQAAIEWNLLRQLADAEWRMRRVPCLEAALLAAKFNETVRYYNNFPERLPEDGAEADLVLIGAAAESDASGGDTFSKLSRYEARLSHRYFKALEHLQKLQSLRQRAAELDNRPSAVPGANGRGAHETGANGTAANGIAANGAANAAGTNRTGASPANPHDKSKVGAPPEPLARRSGSRARISCKHAKARDLVTAPVRTEPARPQPPSPARKTARRDALSARKPASNQRDRKRLEAKIEGQTQRAKRTQFRWDAKNARERGDSARGGQSPAAQSGSTTRKLVVGRLSPQASRLRGLWL